MIVVGSNSEVPKEFETTIATPSKSYTNSRAAFMARRQSKETSHTLMMPSVDSRPLSGAANSAVPKVSHLLRKPMSPQARIVGPISPPQVMPESQMSRNSDAKEFAI